ncbi:MAG: tetraacyldisaccharide 4'-kinase, partial [Acidobacteria bacterium]|nr:tetraacyldisaccharide 4'-kinase [Acidobacteriota bacterium]
MLDRLYGSVALARRRWIERHPALRRCLDRPVISIGNLVVGGTGKTPVVAAIAQWLITRGERPAILSRGYGRARELDGVTVVS